MSKLKIFFVVLTVGVILVFGMIMRQQMAEENCLMGGGVWSAAEKACEG